ncbi:hypothetical protein HAHE_04710 [Haloferula helveola]|uniref:Uncharacterized protein n=1 Tax=Haloferula helveola TaxID=490095 RepID=A0ABM7RB08_9BACT|nr:hypothetical protein HAHE_04710 [Haloferula helveola]
MSSVFSGAKPEGLHRLAADEVLFDDSVEDIRSARVIPDTLRVYDRDRAADTDAQAVGLGSENEWRTASEGGEPSFQMLPRRETDRRVAALRLRGIRAEENVALSASDTRGDRRGPKLFIQVGAHGTSFPSFAAMSS